MNQKKINAHEYVLKDEKVIKKRIEEMCCFEKLSVKEVIYFIC